MGGIRTTGRGVERTVRGGRRREEVMGVATATKPSNERIVEMLDQVLRELEEVKALQAQLIADLRATA